MIRLANLFLIKSANVYRLHQLTAVSIWWSAPRLRRVGPKLLLAAPKVPNTPRLFPSEHFLQYCPLNDCRTILSSTHFLQNQLSASYSFAILPISPSRSQSYFTFDERKSSSKSWSYLFLFFVRLQREMERQVSAILHLLYIGTFKMRLPVFLGFNSYCSSHCWDSPPCCITHSTGIPNPPTLYHFFWGLPACIPPLCTSPNN